MGLSIAHQISRRDDSTIVILDKAPNVGEGSTGASCAILRQRYTHPESVAAARDGLKAHRNWSAYTGLAEPRAKFHHTGFKESPAVGSMIARLLTGAEPDEWDTDAPIEFFSIDREPIEVGAKAVLA